MEALPTCCRTGFTWKGTPVGQEGVLAETPTYITGSSTHSAVILIHDLFGWTFPNLRLLADHFAAEADCTVYMPDFFGGEVIPEEKIVEAFTDPTNMHLLDLPGFMRRNSKDIRYPAMLSCATALKSVHGFTKIAAVGYCYGGWASFRLGSKENAGVVDCVAVAHPSRLEKVEIDDLSVPTLIIAPEHDHAFTEELKTYCNEVIPKKGLRYRYDYHPGLTHGFAGRADESDEVQKKGLEDAKSSVVAWLNERFH